MAFDISTAKPISAGGFDISTAKPVSPASDEEFIGVGESEIDYTPKPEQDLSVGDVAQGVAETGRSFVEGAVFGTPAYMAGAVEGVIRSFVEEGFTPEDAARLANKSAAVFMTPPESQTGQNIAESIGSAADVLPPVFGGVAGQIPGLAQGAKGAATAVRAATPEIPQIPQGRAKQDISRQLIAGQTNEPTAGYRLQDEALRDASMENRYEQLIEGDTPDNYVEFSGESSTPLLENSAGTKTNNITGRVEKFPEAMKLKRQGFEDDVIAGMQQYTKDESQIASRMAKIKRAAKGNINVMRQPLSAVGEVAQDQVKVLMAAKNKAGAKINLALKSMKDKNLNYGGVLEDWRGQLEGQDIKITQNITDDGIRWGSDLRGSKFAGDSGAQKMLDLVADRLSVIANKSGSFENASAKDLHDLKKLIDYRVNWSRLPGDDGLTAEAEALVKSLRSGINDTLRKGSPDYEAANADYAKAITPLVSLNNATGKRVNILDDRLDPEKTGLELRKVISNYASAADLKDAVKGLSLEARQRGYDKNVNLDRLIILNSVLDKRFGVSASKQNSLQGVIEGATSGDPIRMAMETGKAGIKKVRSVDDKKAMNDLIKLFEVKSR